MWKDILEANKENAFNRLNERWRWNLYVRPIRGTNAAEGSDLLAIAKQTTNDLWENHSTYRCGGLVGAPIELFMGIATLVSRRTACRTHGSSRK